MKILFIVPGSGDPFYCGNCFRDNLQANALRKAGHEVVIMPLYLPLKDESFLGDTPLFFPAVSLFVARKYFKRKPMPRWMEKLLNADWSLNMAAAFSGATSSEGLEDMTLSMINGDDRVFHKYVGAMVEWIKRQEKPDIIHLSSSLIIGIAKVIKQEMDIPVACSLQDEEVWIDALGEYAGEAWKSIWDNVSCVDCFFTSSRFYRQSVMQRTARIKNIEVVYAGVNGAKYFSDQYPAHPTVGFFYRMNRLNGLHILAEAFVKLKREARIPGLRLRVGGGYSDADRRFLKEVHKILAPYKSCVDWIDKYSLSEHADFYRKTSVICVPVTFDEAIGLYVCEAFAAGRPVVEPATGSFPEIVANGGILYPENSSDALAEALAKILTNGGLREECCRNALRLAQERYSYEVVAKRFSEIYEKIVNTYRHSAAC